MKDICIIGGGASGLTAAIVAARKGKKVTIIERNNKLGKKILITGNGRCNYWNENQELSHYHSSNSELINKIITDENKDKVMKFFDSLGIIPKIKNGYYYPFSNQAITIENALAHEIKKLNIEVLYDIVVEKIINQDCFIINPDKECIKAKKIIIAAGSKAAPNTGSDGIGYELVKNLNHSIIQPVPALCGLKGEENYFKKWSGVRTEAIITLYEDNKIIKKEEGELQLTDYGISGIPAFNISNFVSKNINNHEEKILINFIPFVKGSSYDWLKKQQKLGLPISETLERALNYKLVEVIIKKSNIKTNSFKKLTTEEFNELVNTLTHFELIIKETNSFNKAQVCAGGVPLTEINLKTMKSKKITNLYLTGEILDVNGDCGGYNLGFAWITGILAGENI